MTTNRLEAFSDGVIDIIITIMVLELKVPHTTEFEGLVPLLPIFISYILSFLYVGIYWNNHHHLFHAAETVTGGTLWANLHLLFWLSLIPFSTGWMGENHFATIPVMLYGFNLLMCALAYTILTFQLVAGHKKGSVLEKALSNDKKGKLSLLFYIAGILLAYFVHSWAGYSMFVFVAFIWLVPDRRIEKELRQ